MTDNSWTWKHVYMQPYCSVEMMNELLDETPNKHLKIHISRMFLNTAILLYTKYPTHKIRIDNFRDLFQFADSRHCYTWLWRIAYHELQLCEPYCASLFEHCNILHSLKIDSACAERTLLIVPDSKLWIRTITSV